MRAGPGKAGRTQSTGQIARADPFRNAIIWGSLQLWKCRGVHREFRSAIWILPTFHSIAWPYLRPASGYWGLILTKISTSLIVLNLTGYLTDTTTRIIVLALTPNSSTFKSYEQHKIGESVWMLSSINRICMEFVWASLLVVPSKTHPQSNFPILRKILEMGSLSVLRMCSLRNFT